MYKKFLYGFLREPATETTNEGNGSTATMDGDAIDKPVTNDDISLYDKYQERIGGSPAHQKPKSGTFADAIEKAMGKDAANGNEKPKDQIKEDADDEDDEESSEEEKKEVSKLTPEEQEEKDLLDIDPSKLKNKSGVPIAKDAQDGFNKLKETIGKKNARIAELLAKTQSTESVDTEEMKTIRTEHAAMKARLDIEDFESSDGFKEAFEAPMEKSQQAVIKFIPKEMSKEMAGMLTVAFKDLHKAAIDDNEFEFARIADGIADEIIDAPKDSTQRALFMKKIIDYQEKAFAHAEAIADKSESRKTVVQNRLEETRNKNVLSVENDLDAHVRSVLADKSELLDSIDEPIRKQWMDSIESGKKVVKGSLARMAITGETPKELGSIIQKGVMYESLNMENKIMAQGLRDYGNKIKILQDKIASYEKKVGKISGQGGGSYVKTTSPRESSGEVKRLEGEGAIEFQLRKAAR